MRALVTRPRADAATVTAALEARGFDVLLEPLIEIVPRADASPDFDGVQGLLFTSANGARALAGKTTRRDLPVWAVGDATAGEALRLGFARVESAGGDVAALANLVTARVDPKAGALLHVAGSVQAGDLAGDLAARGFDVRRALLYDARPAEALSDALKTALAAQGVDIALFFSPRSAATFVRLARAAGVSGLCRPIAAYALSAAVAEALDPPLWRRVRVAERPVQDALLAAIDEDLAAGVAPGGDRKDRSV